MKKLLAIALCLPLVAAAQKKSGAVYSEHPALTVVEDMNAAFCAGDLETYETYFEPEVKIWSVGDEEPHGLERDLQISEWWNKNFDVSITRASGASPDVVEYDGDSKGAWVMDWTEFMAIHKVSGDTVKTWMHDEYFVSDGEKSRLGSATMMATSLEDRSRMPLAPTETAESMTNTLSLIFC